MTHHHTYEIEVVLAHPHGMIRVPLDEWIARGPGARPLLQPCAAYNAQTGAQLSLSAVPLRYRNTVVSRLLIRLKLIQNPWPAR